MLALAGANAVSVVLFVAIYATAGARLLSQAAFVACLIVIFGIATALWVHVEGRHRAIPALDRVGRAAAGLVIVLIAVPALVLMPAFWLDSQLSPDVGFHRFLAPLMTLVLISLVLTVLVNVAGVVVAAGRRLAVGRR